MGVLVRFYRRRDQFSDPILRLKWKKMISQTQNKLIPMIINYFTFKFYAFFEFLWLWSENLGILASKRVATKNVIFRSKSPLFSDFFMESGCLGNSYYRYAKIWWEKCLNWMIYGYFRGLAHCAPLHSSYIQKHRTIKVKKIFIIKSLHIRISHS